MASTLGRIKAVNRVITYKDGRVCNFKEKIIKPCLDKKGYEVVYLSMNCKKYTRKVHRLIATSFLENKEGKPQVNHIDGNKQNNRMDNLEWCTNSENIKHAFSIGLNRARRGSEQGSAIINESIAKKVKSLLKTKTVKEISETLNISKHIVGDIKRNKTWRHV